MPAGPDTVDLITVFTSDYITAGGASADSYIWNIAPVLAGTISGTGNTGTVSWNPNYLGTATVSVQSVNSCGLSSWSPGKVTFVKNSLTGLENQPLHHEPIIYPNPSTGKVYISLERRSKITIISSTGVVLKTLEDFTSGSVDLGKFPEGIYLFRIETPEHSVIQKKVVLF